MHASAPISPTAVTATQYIPSDADKEQPAVLIYNAVERDVDLLPEVNKTDIIHNYAVESTYAGLSSNLPANGVKAFGKAGPFNVFIPYYNARMILDSTGGHTKVMVAGAMGEKEEVDYTLMAKKIEERPTPNSTSFTRDFLDRETAHVMIFLKSNWEHEFVTTTMVREYFEKCDFIVFSCNRPSHKHEGASIGKAGLGSIIHANIRPLDPRTKLNRTDYPAYVVVSGGPPDKFIPFHTLSYEICDHPDLTGILCLKNVACHGYFRAPFEGARLCLGHDNKDNKQGASGSPSQRPPKQQRVTPRHAAAQMLSSFGIDKSKMECRHFNAGTCNPNNKCGFKHPDDPRAAGALIPCALERTPAGCVGGKKCLYAHGVRPGILKQRKPDAGADPGSDLR
jgi:hypothetical protein